MHLCYSRIYIALSNGQWSNVGGMLGKTNVTTIWYCYSVYYDISGGENVGGIVGYLTGEIRLDQSIFNSFTEASFVQGRFGSLKTQLSGQGYVGLSLDTQMVKLCILKVKITMILCHYLGLVNYMKFLMKSILQ